MSLTKLGSGGRPFNRPALEQWLLSPRCRRLLALEEQEMRRVLPDIFGRHVLQIGSWAPESSLLSAAETLHSAVLGTVHGEGQAATIDPENLPLQSKSVDAVLLPHTLEFVRSPHNALREADRVLNDRGRLFVLGFNPWSAWGLRARMGLHYYAFPTGARFYSLHRICDWLQLLDFEVTELRRFGTGFPWLSARTVGDPWNPGSLFSPFCEAYLVSARKRVLPMNFVGRVQKAQIKPLVGLPVPGANSTSASFDKSDT